MIMTILREVLSCRKNLFAGTLVLLVALVFGFEGIYAGEKTKKIDVWEGKSQTLKLKEGDGITFVDVSILCKEGKVFQLYDAEEGGWIPQSHSHHLIGVDEDGDDYEISGIGLPADVTRKFKYRCVKEDSDEGDLPEGEWDDLPR